MRRRLHPEQPRDPQDPGVLSNGIHGKGYPLNSPLPWYLVLLYCTLLVGMGAVSIYFYYRLPEPVMNGHPNQFHASNARAHMEAITDLGIRHVGSDANEVHAKELILRKVEDIRDKASREVEIEVSVQHPSASYYVDLFGGMTHIYQNITNIVVRLYKKGSDPEHAFMVNAHYDSALGSVAASDDALSCGIMLEVMRCLSSEPAPLLAEHSLIFLFNGAEETMLQASHGFITQHPWAKSIRAFLNLEAAGAGGREIVFQTGPGHPWLARLYSELVPHPHASVVAQEIFQSGIIPSDTDFRVFRDFGSIPGIDTAYFVNGYVYHTEYDVPSAIPDGSIQHAGDNTLALLKGVANSPLLANHDDTDLHDDQIVFFDILGMMTVVYTERLAYVLNLVVTFLAGLMILTNVNWSHSKYSDKPTLNQLFLSFCVMLLSWLAAVMVTLAEAGLLTLLGTIMSWFSRPLLLIPLYAIPAFLVIAEVHAQFLKRTEGSYSQASMEKGSFLSILILMSGFLVLFTLLHLSSGFVFFIIVSFQLIFRSFLLDTLLSHELRKKRNEFVYQLSYVLCSAFSFGLPFMLLSHFDLAIFQLFIPLMGRSGALVPPDLVIGGLMAAIVGICTPYMINVVIYSTSKSMKRWGGLCLLIVSLLTLIMTGAGLFPPYSVEDSDFPTPKRLFLIHTDREFYALDGSITSEDSNIVLYPYDYLGIKPIAEAAPEFREAKFADCEGLYCQEATYIPVRHIINAWHIPASKLEGRAGPEVRLIASEKTSKNSRNFTFEAKFPQRCTAIIGASEGVALKAWSLDSFIPQTNNCPGSHEKQGCYHLFFARGFGNAPFNFWIEIEGDMEIKESLRVAVTAHHLEPPLSQTPELSHLTKALPDWVTEVAWTAVYRQWIF